MLTLSNVNNFLVLTAYFNGRMLDPISIILSYVSDLFLLATYQYSQPTTLSYCLSFLLTFTNDVQLLKYRALYIVNL